MRNGIRPCNMTGIPLSNKHRSGCAGGGGEKPARFTLVFSMGGSDILFKSGRGYLTQFAMIRIA